MFVLRALVYFFEEAVTSLWRSRLINALSIGTIAVSLFVVGAFLTVSNNLSRVVAQWTEKAQVIFYLEDGLEARIEKSLTDRLQQDPAVDAVRPVSREEALTRFKALFADLGTLADDLGENPFPASIEVTLKVGHESGAEVKRLVEAFTAAPGVEDIQYDLRWIERLSAAIRLVRGVAGFLGGVLVLAGVFTISNVIRLTVYARQDELDIMRLVGATQAYVRGPFVVEGLLQGMLGGLVSVGLLHAAFHFLTEDLSRSDLLSRAQLALPAEIGLFVVSGGMAVGVIGSLVSLGRFRV